MRIRTHAVLWTGVMALAVGCGKKDGSGDDAAPAATDGAADGATDGDKTDGGETGNTALSDNIKVPSGALALALGSMESVMATNISSSMVGGGAALADDGGFSEADCDEHAEAKWRSTDGPTFKDETDRLLPGHPRASLQSLYCQMQKDTGSPDSFLGSISQSKLLFCVMKDLKFDNTAHDVTIAKTDFEACLDAQGFSEENKKEMIGNMGDTVPGKITASAPAAFGAAGQWTASIEFNVDVGGPQVLKILLKDDAENFAMMVNNNGGHANPTDGYVVQISKKTGEIRFESKMQRIREANGGSNAGWNRHARVYIKGTFDANLKFTAVTDVQGAYSDISINYGNTSSKDPASPVAMGKIWSVVGNDTTGFLSNTYALDCTYSMEQGVAPTCKDPNKAASWIAFNESAVAACNGAAVADDDKCTGTDLKLASDVDTGFTMDAKNPAFEKTEDWAASLNVPSYTTVDFKITQ